MRYVKGHNRKRVMCQIIAIAMIIALKTSHPTLHYKTVRNNQSDIPVVNLISPAFLKTIGMAHIPFCDVTIGV